MPLLKDLSSSAKHSDLAFISCKVKSVVPRCAVSPGEYYSNWNEVLKCIGLIEQLWKTYRVNALYNFDYDEISLKRYENLLLSVVEEDTSKIANVSREESQKFCVNIEACDVTFDDYDFPPVIINIMGLDEEEDDLFFEGILLSVGREKGFFEEERKSAGATILPLFLVHYADEVYFTSVKYFLEENFGCLVSPLTFSSRDLIWMVALFSPKNESQECLVSTRIEYELPDEDLSSIWYAIDPLSIIHMWKKIMPDDESEKINEKQAFEFFANLENYIYRSLHPINLSGFPLRKIKTSLASVVASGVVVFYDTPWLYCIVMHLTQVAHEIKEL